jgi:serine/threonine protein kinase/CRP-like cAMP-binding protein
MNETFGRYQILQQVAQGGMAEIVLARSLSGTARVCALKRILPQFSKDLQFVSMFIDEARITIGLDHENVVHLYDFGQVDGTYFMAMEYVDGTDLAALFRTVVAGGRSLPPVVAASIVADVARGLCHAHGLRDAAGHPQGIVHRDVSPQNVLLSSTGQVKVTDFGIAAAKNKLTLTSPGVVLGKAAYMAPEQATGRGVDFRSDLWALGVILWELLVGERLFAADNPVLTLQRAMTTTVAAPSTLRPEVPRALDDLVLSLLQREKGARPRASIDVVRALDDVCATLARTSPLAPGGVFGPAQRAAFLASVQWSDQTAPMRPRALASPSRSPARSAAPDAAAVDDAPLARLLERCATEQDPWLLVDVGERAVSLGRAELARSAFRTAAAAFASRGLLVQSLVAHAGARPLLAPDDARDDVIALGDVTPGHPGELDALLRRLDGHGLARGVSRELLPVPPPVPLLGALGPRELAQLAAVVTVRRVRKGDVIVREGERGNALYAVGRGRFVVSCQPGEPNRAVELPTTLAGPAGAFEADAADGFDFAAESTHDSTPLRAAPDALSQQHQGRIFIAGLADGDFFGEFSFLAQRARSATVEAVTDGLLLEIQRDAVDNVAANDAAFTAPLLAFYKERVVELMMAKSPVFSLLAPVDRKALLDAARVVDVEHDALIVREGTRNDSLFFIRRGEVEVFRRDRAGLSIFINKLGQGQFFGEIAALKGTPRTVSVRAIGAVSMFQIEGRLLNDVVDRQPRLRAMFDAMIARRAAEAKARVLEHDLLLLQT